MKSILVIGAHPDDGEVGAAGLFQRGGRRFGLIASRGERGGDAEQREREAKEAFAFVNAEGRILRHPDTAIQAADLAIDIERAIRDFQPDLILTTSPHDAHQDHAAVARATMIATRDFCGTILGYYTPSVAERFRPNWFVALTEAEMAAKIRVVGCHASQSKRHYLAPAYLEAAGRYWAQVTRSKAPFVEPYELLRHREDAP